MSMQQFDEKAKEEFKRKLDDLIERGKNKKNVLEYQEITDTFHDMKLDEEQYDLIMQRSYHSRQCQYRGSCSHVLEGDRQSAAAHSR